MLKIYNEYETCVIYVGQWILSTCICRESMQYILWSKIEKNANKNHNMHNALIKER